MKTDMKTITLEIASRIFWLQGFGGSSSISTGIKDGVSGRSVQYQFQRGFKMSIRFRL